MEELKESTSCNDVELLSEEVQEVMNRIPSVIVRWGMSLIAVIVTILLLVAAYLPWPETQEYPFEGQRDGTNTSISITLSPESIRSISNTYHQKVTLYSPIFPEYGASGIINYISIGNNTGNEYSAQLNIELVDTIIFRDTINTFSGNILLIVSKDTLLQRIIEHIRQ